MKRRIDTREAQARRLTFVVGLGQLAGVGAAVATDLSPDEITRRLAQKAKN